MRLSDDSRSTAPADRMVEVCVVTQLWIADKLYKAGDVLSVQPGDAEALLKLGHVETF